MQAAKSRLEDYLATIYRLEEAFGVAKVTDIASELGVSPATVSKVVKRLEERGFVAREKYYYVALTEAGRRVAEAIIRKHRIAEAFLASTLGFNDYESHHYAHLFEHLPGAIIERLYVFLGSPETCPHGNPLPGGPRAKAANELLKLVNVAEGNECTVKRLVGELRELLEFTAKAELRVGSTIVVESRDTSAIKIRLVGGKQVAVPLKVASLIVVECTPRAEA